MSAKTILSRGHLTLGRWVATRALQSAMQCGRALLRQGTAHNWPGIEELDVRQLRDIGLAQVTQQSSTVPSSIGIVAGQNLSFGAGL